MIYHIIEDYFKLRDKLKQNKDLLKQTADYILENIELLNSDINAYCQIYKDEVLQSVNNYNPNKTLSGMMVGLKDLICYQNHPVQASSNILKGFVSQINATVTQRIIDNGGTIVGHQNCDEFGMGSATKNSCHGPARNGMDIKKTAGGSSGGSAAAVQTNMCHVALGTDTGGSVRQPAAFCGIIGLKPTYGRISRYGVIAYSSSFDTVGILGKNIEDIAILLENIAGKDEKDCTSSNCPVDKYFDNLNAVDFSNTKIAYIGETLELQGLQREIHDTMLSFITKLRNDNYVVDKQNFKYLNQLVPVYYTITTAEATANFARYDGLRYGFCGNENFDKLEDLVKFNRSYGFGREVKKRMLFGNYVLMQKGALEQAQKVRRIIVNEIKNIFKDYEFIILPVTPTTAFDLDKDGEDPHETFLADIFTELASMGGFPAISIPYGKDEKGLPIGIQIIANHFEEQKLLSFAKQILNSVDF